MSSPQLKSQNREEDDILTRDCRELYGANYIVETYNELTTKAKADLDTAASKREGELLAKKAGTAPTKMEANEEEAKTQYESMKSRLTDAKAARKRVAKNIIVKGTVPITSTSNAARDALKTMHDHKMSVDANSAKRVDQLKQAL